jgi:hypothetical protein
MTNTDVDRDRIRRIALLLVQLWSRHPHLRLGQLLEVVSGRKPEVMLLCTRENLQMKDAQIKSIPADLWNISDKEWESKLEGILRAGDIQNFE